MSSLFRRNDNCNKYNYYNQYRKNYRNRENVIVEEKEEVIKEDNKGDLEIKKKEFFLELFNKKDNFCSSLFEIEHFLCDLNKFKKVIRLYNILK